ncbi:MAG: response regulator, partial [Eubacterium sp.]
MKVIAVDDEVLALQSIVRELQKIERITEVQGFCSSEETLMYLEANPVDVVFLDIEMEPLSGLALADKIKLNWPKVFIIFVTAYSQYAVEAFQIHAFGYLLKPVNTERIEKELDY